MEETLELLSAHQLRDMIMQLVAAKSSNGSTIIPENSGQSKQIQAADLLTPISSSSRAIISEVSKVSKDDHEETSSSSLILNSQLTSKSGDHYLFSAPPLNLSPYQFNCRLSERLSKEKMALVLASCFPEFNSFRDTFLQPLSIIGETIVAVENIKGFNSAEFSQQYSTLFVHGCLVQRMKRKRESKAEQDTKERIQYRNLLSVLWSDLGNIMLLKTADLLDKHYIGKLKISTSTALVDILAQNIHK